MNTALVYSYISNPNLFTLLDTSLWQGTPADRHGRFLNLNHPFKPNMAQVLKWKLEKNQFAEEKKAKPWHPTVLKDTHWLNQQDDCLVWLGHSTFYIRLNGIQLLTDPVFGDIFTVKRASELPIDPARFRNLDYILLSHDHRDHLDQKSLALLARNNPSVTYLSGLKMESIIQRFTQSDQIETAGWYQQYSTDTTRINIYFLPSRHWSKRGLRDTNQRLWGGFVIQANGKSIYFGGDSGYDNHFGEAGKLFGGFDYAILGIGAYEPAWFMRPNHQSPQEALQAFQELKARFFIPMHYGTFDLSNEPLGNPIQELLKHAKGTPAENSILDLKIGQPLGLS